MVADVLLQSFFSAVAGLVVGVTTALLTEYRENRRWLRTKVHQPLYGELTEVISGDLPEGEDGYVSLWAGLEYYKTYRVDAALAESLDRYSSELSELSAVERDEDVDAFVDALPDSILDGDGPHARLPSGRSVDMRTWIRRNVLVLSTAPAYRDAAFGFEPSELSFLWAEVDGVEAPGDGDDEFETGEALAVVSREFNWGYEAFYEHWEDGWEEELAAALLAASEPTGNAVQEMLVLRREVGETAGEIKSMIETRADRGLLRSLWNGVAPSRIRDGRA